MTSFDTWTINRPWDVEDFDMETRMKHLDAPNPTYHWPGKGAGQCTGRDEFLADARERAGRESFEIWAATNILVGENPSGEPSFRVSGLDCWTEEPVTPEETQAAREALERHPVLPF